MNPKTLNASLKALSAISDRAQSIDLPEHLLGIVVQTVIDGGGVAALLVALSEAEIESNQVAPTMWAYRDLSAAYLESLIEMMKAAEGGE